MSVTTTSYVLDKGMTWPYVKLPHFDKRGSQVLQASDAKYMSLCPLVTEDQKEAWANWSSSNLDWIPHDPTYPTPLVAPVISSYNTSTGGIGGPMLQPVGDLMYHAPLWQVEPAFPSLVNLDVFDIQQNGVRVFAVLYEDMISSRTTSLASLATAGEFDPDDEHTWPSAFVSAPIFEDFSETSNITAFYSTTLAWHKAFVNLLPSTAKGIYLVIENSCGQDVTYRMDGPKVQYLGIGDLHERRFDRLAMISDFNITGHNDDTHDHGSCSYQLALYPSTDLYNQYQTDRPVMYTVAVVLIFALTSMVFVLYDCLVQRRQRAVMSSAQRSNAIISSLFPEQVRQRLMGEDNTTRRGDSVVRSNKGRAQERESSPVSGINNSKPIADLFPSATIMYVFRIQFLFI